MVVQLVCFLAFVCALHAVNSYHVPPGGYPIPPRGYPFPPSHPSPPQTGIPNGGRTGEIVEPTEPKLLCRTEKESCFRYELSSDIGPKCWFAIDHDRNRCCSPRGRFQSPISIPHISHTEHIDRELRYNCHKFVGKLENNGLYPKFVPQDEEAKNEDKPNLSGLTTDTYVFDNIHIHFGARGKNRQTEHVVEDGPYIAEVHLVHHHSDFDNITDAKNQTNGIAVIGIFLSVEAGSRNAALDAILCRLREVKEFDREDESNVCAAENEYIKNGVVSSGHDSENYKCQKVITATLNDTQQNEVKKCLLLSHGDGCGDTAENIKIYPNDLLDNDQKYYHYQGGLTTPPCSESVLWYVQKEPVRVDWSVINDLAAMESRISNKYISDVGNLRPLQKRADRTITLLEFE